MQRWKGWGDDEVRADLPLPAAALLREKLGEGAAVADCLPEDYLNRIPHSRMPHHPLISHSPRARLDHAHGRSLSDRIHLRMGLSDDFPDGVAMPETEEEVEELLQFADAQKIVVIPFGGGTAISGDCMPGQGDRPVMILSLAGMKKMRLADEKNRVAVFEAGITGPDLEAGLSAHGLTLGHFPGSFEYGTLGGWIMTRSKGMQDGYYGGIESAFLGGTVITPIGPLRFPEGPGSFSGPDLKGIWVGSRGRLGVLTSAVMRVSRIPEVDEIHGICFPCMKDAVDAARALCDLPIPFSMIRINTPGKTMANLTLTGRESSVAQLKETLKKKSISIEEAGICLVGIAGSRELAESYRKSFLHVCGRIGVLIGKTPAGPWRRNRFGSVYLENTLWDLGYAVDGMETVVPWDRSLTAVEKIETAVEKSLLPWNEKGYAHSLLFPVNASGSGIRTTILFRRPETPEETLAKSKAVRRAAERAVSEMGELFRGGKGTEVGRHILKKIAAELDPDNLMNPGKSFV